MDTAGGIILPDTVAMVDGAPRYTSPINFGCFATRQPSRFSCLDLTDSCKPQILTKPDLHKTMLAWGMVIWDRDAAATFRAFDHCDRAFEAVMQERGFGLFMLSAYADLGSYTHYREFLIERRIADHVP